MAKRRIEIRNMFVYAASPSGSSRASKMDVAILTPEDGYVEYELAFVNQRMTHTAYRTIKSLLADYQFTRASEVCMTEAVSAKNPLAMYLDILAQQMGFGVYRVSEKKISDRMCRIVRGVKSRVAHDKNLEGQHIEAIWRYLVESGKCKWVTPAYAESVAGMGERRRKRKKLVRIGAYYMRLRRLKYEYTLRSKSRAAGGE